MSKLSLKEHFKNISQNGPYGPLAPHNRGKSKSKYVSYVFDAAIFQVLANIPQRESVLDYGCGTGILSVQLLSYFNRVVGLDISEDLLKIAESIKPNQGNIQFQCIEGNHIPLDDESFDLVIARESLCFLKDQTIETIVGEIYRILRKNGIFLWLDQASENPKFQHHVGSPNLIKRSVKEIKAIALKGGFHIQDKYVVRKPRFPWIYPITFGFIPDSLSKKLAYWETRFNKRFFSIQSNRWHNVLFILSKNEH
jgi:SAM-dependent methyltransferase